MLLKTFDLIKRFSYVAIFVIFSLGFSMTPVSGQGENCVHLEGKYQVVGTNPDGGKYRGSAQISKSGSTYQLQWNIKNSGTYQGTGLLIDDVFVVSYEDEQIPGIVAYEIQGKQLKGRWAVDKKGNVQSEILTKNSPITS
ncbi:MAG: hypothetical protein ABEJ65_10210, partial [bacterium]